MKTNFYKNGNYLLILGVLVFASCIKNVEEDSEQIISFEKNVKPILDANCVSCHGPNTPNLTTINSIISNAASVREQVVTGQMPIGSSLTTNEINIIVDWVDAGALDN